MNISKFSLEGKVALVTGGTHGVGRAIALTFADAGADVVISARKLPALEETAKEINARGKKSLAVASDVGRIEESQNLVEKAKKEFGRIDILVNNAVAALAEHSLLDAEEKAWDVIMDVNLKGPFFLSQMVARLMRQQGGGKIINIASWAGIKPMWFGIYSVSKAGVIMLTKYMAKEWGKYNINVNAVAPGFVKTRLSESLWKDPAVEKEEAWKNTVIGRLGTPGDIAGAVLYLASDASNYVTGETIIVDGGGLLI